MDVCTLLETDLHHRRHGPLPLGWVRDPVLGAFGSLTEVVAAVRRLSGPADGVVRALLAQPDSDRDVVPVLLVGLTPVVLARSRSRRVVDEYLAELTVELTSAHRFGPPVTTGLLVSRLLDRAWDRVRAPIRRPEPVVPIDPAGFAWERPATGPGPEDVALVRVTAAELRAAVWRERSDEGFVAAWNTAVELADAEPRTAAEGLRWKYARRRLRRRCPVDLVA